jgi:hypothetical protein
MRALSRAGAALLLAAVGGCGIQFSNLDRSAKVTRQAGEAIVVLAVQPRSRVSLFEGQSRGGDWTCKSLFNIANVYPESGFIVLKLEPRTGDKNYGIGQVLPDGIGGDSFIVHRGAVVPSFHAPPGKVTFVRGIRLARDGRRMSVEPDESTTVEDARRFLQSNYPALAGDVADDDPLVFLRADGGC